MVSLLDRALRYILIFLIGLLTASVFLQVLIRFVFKSPLPWTEEVARIAFVYSIFVGATIGVRDRAHISVDFLVVLLPPHARRALKLATNIVVAVLLCFIIWQGIEFVRQTGVQMTPVMLIPFRYLYIVIPASGALMLLYLILGTIDDLRGVKSR